MTGKELRALRRLQREQDTKSPFVFRSERGTPFTKRGFQAMVERAGKATGFDMKIHPHMLRHACGFKLANDGVDTRTIQAYLGHKSIQHTGALHRAGTNSVQKLIPGLTAPVASFEATVGGSSCPRRSRAFQEISRNARWVPFCVERACATNEEVSPRAAKEIKRHPALPLPQKRTLFQSMKIEAPVLPPLKMLGPVIFGPVPPVIALTRHEVCRSELRSR